MLPGGETKENSSGKNSSNRKVNPKNSRGKIRMTSDRKNPPSNDRGQRAELISRHKTRIFY